MMTFESIFEVGIQYTHHWSTKYNRICVFAFVMEQKHSKFLR